MRYAIILAVLASSGACLAADANLARNLAATCANCHGTNGHSVDQAIEPLAGVDAAKLLKTMKAFQSGDKPATVMHQISKGYSDEQLNLIAGYYASQK